MKTTTHILSWLLAACLPFTANAQDDPLSKYLIPPPFIMQNADEIGLTSEQRGAIQQTGEKAHKQNSETVSTLEQAVGLLGKELQNDPIDAAAAMAKLDKVLDAERAMKHIHLEMLITANNLLKPEQRAALRKLRASSSSGRLDHSELEQRLKAKVQRVQKGVEAQAQAGQPPFDVVELMDTFTPLMEKGKHDEAEQVLNKAIKLLEGEDAKLDKKEPAPESSAVESPKPPTPPVSIDSPDALKKEIASMRVDDVEWRKIAWKTCLLDGLKASREQNKPIILWVFIDRPIDDKRC